MIKIFSSKRFIL